MKILKKVFLDWPLCVSVIMTILPKLKINITKLKKTFLSIIRTLTKFYQKKNFKLKNKESLLTKKIKEELNLLIEN